MLDAAPDHVDVRPESFEDVLRDLIRIPSISSDPAFARDVRRSATAFADAMSRGYGRQAAIRAAVFLQEELSR